ncbi:MAG: tetratricopeptide repeat protein [Flavobacteriales bacterium]
MRTNFFCLLFAAMLAACSGSNPGHDASGDAVNQPTTDAEHDATLIEIRDLEQKTKSDTAVDRATQLRLLRAYQDYYNAHPQDSLGRHFLFEAARVADAMNKFDKAIELLGNYHDAEPQLERKAEAAYMVAFIYDAHLHNAEQANLYYNKVIQNYPSTLWAKEADKALHLVGKSDQEILDMIHQKNNVQP